MKNKNFFSLFTYSIACMHMHSSSALVTNRACCLKRGTFRPLSVQHAGDKPESDETTKAISNFLFMCPVLQQTKQFVPLELIASHCEVMISILGITIIIITTYNNASDLRL